MKAYLRFSSSFQVAIWFTLFIVDIRQSRSTDWLIAELATIVFFLAVYVFTLPTGSPKP